MILAAGLGTRMRPLSHDLPKPLMPLWNESLLARHVNLLKDWGVSEILLNVHFAAEQVIQEAIRLLCPTCRINVSHEPDILGTGGALAKGAWFFDAQPFWLLNADVVLAHVDPVPFWQALHSDPAVLAACWVDPERGPRTVRMRSGRITDFAVSRPGTSGTFTFCGLHCARGELLSLIPKTGLSSVIEAYQRARARGRIIRGVELPDSYWEDAGTPDRYIQAHVETAPFFSSPSSSCISPSAHIAPDVTLRDSVVWDQARITPGSILERAVIGRASYVSGKVTGVVLRAEHVLMADEMAVIKRIAPPPHDSLTANLLPARGSARSYIRIISPGWTGILMRYDPERVENTLFCGLARALRKARWPVPAIWADSTSGHWALMEDVGHHSLGDQLAAEPDSAQACYTAVIKQLLRLHGPVTRTFRKHPPFTLPPFNSSVYKYERDLFTQFYLLNREEITFADAHRINRQLKAAIRPLLDLKQVYIHRDMQSSNVHWHRNGPVFIDFQGMRLGAAPYDLASLLCDPYVELPDEVQNALLAEYGRCAAVSTFSMETYRIACVQRLCQALGAYARLSALPGCERFEVYIPVARKRLSQILSQTDIVKSMTSIFC